MIIIITIIVVVVIVILKVEGSRPEWCISSMIYRRDTPFWSENLFIYLFFFYDLVF